MTPPPKVHRYEGRGGIVTYDAKRCIHAAECVHGLPAVFDSKAKPWINPDGADAGDPRGHDRALPERRAAGRAPRRRPPRRCRRRTRPRSPRAARRILRGDLALMAADGSVGQTDTRMALCRCGGSQNKPFCDGSHEKLGFADDGRIACRRGPGRPGRRRSPGNPRASQRPADADGTPRGDRDERTHGARRVDVPVPLRPLGQQALLRRHAQEGRVRRPRCDVRRLPCPNCPISRSTARHSPRASADRRSFASGSGIRSCCAPPCRRSAMPSAGASSACAGSASAS